MIGQHVHRIRGPFALVRQRLLINKILQEPKLWQTYLREQVQKHPVPWAVVKNHWYLVVANDGKLVYSCQSLRRAKMIVKAANYFGG